MIDWGSLFIVQLVSIGSTIAVVVLVSLAVLGLSTRGRTPVTASARHVAGLSARSGRTLGAISLVLAAAIVLFGLWAIVAR
jgi:hypothetical protein